MSKWLPIAFVIFCAHLKAQSNLHSISERYIIADVLRINSTYLINNSNIQNIDRLFSIVTGEATGNVKQLSMEVEGSEGGQHESHHLGKKPNMYTMTFSANGSIDGTTFELLTTLFSDTFYESVRISKQAAYINFTDFGSMYEVIRYDFIASDGNSAGYLLWKKVYDTTYTLSQIELDRSEPPMLKANSQSETNWLFILDMMGRLVSTQSCSNCELSCVPNLEALASGMYILKSECSDITSSRKIIVSR
jgi:hypothetical protein